MGVANKKTIHIATTILVNNAHLVNWTPYAEFQHDWSINEFLASIMMSYRCGNDLTTPIDTHM